MKTRWLVFLRHISSSLSAQASLRRSSCRAPPRTPKRLYAAARIRPPGTSGFTSFAVLTVLPCDQHFSRALCAHAPHRLTQPLTLRLPLTVDTSQPWWTRLPFWRAHSVTQCMALCKLPRATKTRWSMASVQHTARAALGPRDGERHARGLHPVSGIHVRISP